MLRPNKAVRRISLAILYLIFVWCVWAGLFTIIDSYPGSDDSFVLAILVGSCLGLVLRPKWLRWLTAAVVLICVWVLFQGYELRLASKVPRKAALGHNGEEFQVYSIAGSVGTPKTFLDDVSVFALAENFQRDRGLLGAQQRFVRTGRVPAVILAGYRSDPGFGTFDVVCRVSSSLPATLAQAFQTRYREKYILKEHFDTTSVPLR